jgi:hypothetical protein
MIKRLIAYRAIFALLVAIQPTIRLQELAEEGRVLAQQVFVNRVLLGLDRFTDIQADNLGSKLGVRLLQDASRLL